jgi:hypothetical protein
VLPQGSDEVRREYGYAKPAAIEQPDNQRETAVHLRVHASHLVLGQYDRQVFRPAGPDDAFHHAEVPAEYVPVLDQQGLQRLVLRGCRYLAIHRGGPQFARMPFTVEADEAPDPVQIGLLGTVAAMLDANLPADGLGQGARGLGSSGRPTAC